MQPFDKYPDMIVQGEQPLNLEAPWERCDEAL